MGRTFISTASISKAGFMSLEGPLDSLVLLHDSLLFPIYSVDIVGDRVFDFGIVP